MNRLLATTTATLALLALPSAASADTLRVSVGDDGSGAPEASGPPAVSGNGVRLAFTSRARLTAADTRGRVQLYVRDLSTGRTVMASTSAGGVAGDGDVVQDPARPAYALSGDGRFVVFVSEATDLAPDANGAARDVFRKDLVTGAVTLVSRGWDGAQAAGSVLGQPDVSADGRRVAFATGAAQGLYQGDPSPASDVVVRDLATGTVTLASVRAQGGPVSGVDAPSISADGSTVAFVTADAAVTGDLNAAPDVFVRNLSAGTTTLVSAGPGGAPAGGTAPDLSGGGGLVAFQTAASLVGAADANGVSDVYVRDLTTGVPTLASAADGQQVAAAGASQGGSISADGQRVAFVSEAASQVPGDANGAVADVHVRDIAARSTRRVSVGAAGVQVAGQRASGSASISGNGASVGFAYDDGAPSVGLLPADANGQRDAYVGRIGALDVAGPQLELAEPAQPTGARVLPVSGRVSDPSGVWSVVLNGVRALVDPTGAFTVPVRLAVGPGLLVVTAVDTVGNVTRLERPVGRDRAGPAAPPPAARLSGLRLRLRGARMIVSFQLSDLAIVRAELVARLPAAEGRPRAQLQRQGRATVRTLFPGARGVPLVLPPRLAPARYQVRVTAVSAGGVSVVTTPFVVEDPDEEGRVADLSVSQEPSRVVVSFTLLEPAQVRAELLVRRPSAAGRPPRLVRTGRATVRTLASGAREIPIRVPARLAPVRYVVRVTAAAAGGMSVSTRPLVVRR